MSQKRPALKQGTLNFLSKPSARKNPREICNAGSESAGLLKPINTSLEDIKTLDFFHKAVIKTEEGRKIN